MLLVKGAHVSMLSYTLALRGHVHEHLPLILCHTDLPKGRKLDKLVQTAMHLVNNASFWLPLLLKAGLDPLLLIQQKM